MDFLWSFLLPSAPFRETFGAVWDRQSGVRCALCLALLPAQSCAVSGNRRLRTVHYETHIPKVFRQWSRLARRRDADVGGRHGLHRLQQSIDIARSDAHREPGLSASCAPIRRQKAALLRRLRPIRSAQRKKCLQGACSHLSEGPKERTIPHHNHVSADLVPLGPSRLQNLHRRFNSGRRLQTSLPAPSCGVAVVEVEPAGVDGARGRAGVRSSSQVRQSSSQVRQSLSQVRQSRVDARRLLAQPPEEQGRDLSAVPGRVPQLILPALEVAGLEQQLPAFSSSQSLGTLSPVQRDL